MRAHDLRLRALHTLFDVSGELHREVVVFGQTDKKFLPLVLRDREIDTAKLLVPLQRLAGLRKIVVVRCDFRKFIEDDEILDALMTCRFDRWRRLTSAFLEGWNADL